MAKKKPKENANGHILIGIRMPITMKDEMDRLADEGSRPFSAEIRLACTAHINNSPSKTKGT